MAGWAVVALPEQDDKVWQISSEKKPHMTLLFLGEPAGDPPTEHIVEFIDHAVRTSLRRFGMSVDRRGLLGPEDADVVFFETNFAKDIEDFRSFLLQDDEISKMFNSTEQYPEWIPHLTLGYPATPANEDDRDYPGIHWVNFDRIALWTEDYDGPEFVLKSSFDTEVSMADSTDLVLAHYGVKGMRWGRRKNSDGSYSPSGKREKSQDHKDAEELKKKRPSQMSNTELRKLNERMQLEQTYAQLMSKQGNKVTKGQNYIKDALSVAKTGQEIYNLANSPAGKAARELVEQALKR